ncbi:MAG: hypothetical protein RLZ35_764 [Pseudomonadota bacterium]|jgi:uncharacterized protein (TIGR02421 family)
MSEKEYHATIKALSDRIVQAQRPIRVLDALKWGPEIQQTFFNKSCQVLPAIDAQYYEKNPLKFDPDKKIEEFQLIERAIRKELGQFNGIGEIMIRMCQEYATVIDMLKARGTPSFSRFAQQLYGSSEDVFYAGGPSLKDLAEVISKTLKFIDKKIDTEEDEKNLNSQQAVEILRERLHTYFDQDREVRVEISDNILADAAAGAETIKLRTDAKFSMRDLRVLEVHEGWVHLGTTINGLLQPTCTFLSKGPPSSTVTQEGLAIIMEVFTFSSHPNRMRAITDRVRAINMAENGADFLEVFRFFEAEGMSLEESYAKTSRAFRGSTPTLGPFTKDLSYNKGFILIYNYIRLAIQKGLVERIPLLLLGKTTLEDLKVWDDLVQEGVVIKPRYLPKQFKDLAALSSWMCYSLFLNQLNLKRLASEYKGIL